jgi:TRAP-type mannitol/chloroaromatic compound transport system substrate-binding protein
MKKRIVMLVLAMAVIVSLVVVGCAPEAAPPPEEEEEAPPPEEEEEAPPAPPEAEVITWIGQSTLPAGMPVSVGLEELADRIAIASGGRLVWEPKPAGAVCPATEEWKAIDKGVLDFCAGGGSYMTADIPFGSIISQRVGARLSPLAHMVWFEVGGRDMINRLYKDMGYDFMDVGGLHGLPEGWIHLDRELKGPGDLKGLKMRCSGDGGTVLSRMGVGSVFMPLGEIFENMKRGVIDAFECSNPAFDWDMGLYEVGKYYYMNPTRAPWEDYEILVKRSKWEELPDDLKVIVEDCCLAESVYYHSRLVAANGPAIQNFKDYGVIVDKLPTSIEEAFIEEANKYLDERAAEFPEMDEVLTSQREFEAMWAELYGLPA